MSPQFLQGLSISGFSTLLKGTSAVLEKKMTVSAFHTPETEASILVLFSQSQSCKNADDNTPLASGDRDWCVCLCGTGLDV